jgi:uncharacterized protein YndB with AHSA1/START domain
MGLNFASELTIQAPPEKVFDAMTNLEQSRLWMNGLVRMEKLTQGEFGVGTEFRETRKMFGKEASEHFEVTSCEHPKRLALRVDGTKGASGKGEYFFHYELTPEGGCTRLHVLAEVRMEGFFSNMIGRVFLGTFKKACDKDLSALKTFVEQGSEPHFAPPQAF